MVLGAGVPRSGYHHGQVLISLFQIADCYLMAVSGGRGEEVSSLDPLYRGTNPFMKVPLSGPNHVPKAPLPDTISLDIRFQHINFEETQSMAYLFFNYIKVIL